MPANNRRRVLRKTHHNENRTDNSRYSMQITPITLGIGHDCTNPQSCSPNRLKSSAHPAGGFFYSGTEMENRDLDEAACEDAMIQVFDALREYMTTNQVALWMHGTVAALTDADADEVTTAMLECDFLKRHGVQFN